jgi:hypothetical protein
MLNPLPFCVNRYGGARVITRIHHQRAPPSLDFPGISYAPASKRWISDGQWCPRFGRCAHPGGTRALCGGRVGGRKQVALIGLLG